MRRVKVPISNFQFGEISPSLISRTDSAVYAQSAQKVENLFLRAEGGVIKRAGLKHLYEFDTTFEEASFTITVSDYGNIIVGSTIKFFKGDGTLITLEFETAGGSSPSSSSGNTHYVRANTDNNTTADNIYTAINAHADFTVANPAAAVVTVTETTHGASGFLTIVTSDTTRLATTDEGHSVVESVAVIPGTDGSGQVHDSTSRDEVWIQVKRTINGNTVRYVEFQERDYEADQNADDAVYSDSCITYDSSSASTITGLTHLEGQTVKIWADNAIQADKVVSSGSISLDVAASVVQVGLSYTHKLKTLKIEGGNAAGTSVGRNKRINGLTFVLLNSHTIEYGPTASDLDKNDFREVSDAMDSATPLFTGELFVEFEGNWQTDPRIYVESDDPAPFTLLAIAPEVKINALK